VGLGLYQCFINPFQLSSSDYDHCDGAGYPWWVITLIVIGSIAVASPWCVVFDA